MSTIELFTRRWGDTGDPVVLLHGLSGSSVHYESLAPELVAQGWSVTAPDLRGHGGSPRAPGTYTIEYYAADIASLLESLPAPAIVAGHSLGGAIAVYLAGSRPDVVRGAFAEDPPLYHGQPGVMAASGYAPVFRSMCDTMRDLQQRGEPAIRAMLQAMPGPGDRPWVDTVTPATFEARVESFGDCDPDVWEPAIVGEALAGWNPERPIQVPVTILRADPTMGPALTAAEAARFGAANPSAQIVEVLGAPHSIREYLPTADRYRAELTTFLGAQR